jgi:ribosomal protein S18 acetylase RimI-like enzyme
MIRQMKHGEEGKIRELLAKLSHEDYIYWHKTAKPYETCLQESSKFPITEEVKSKSVILVAEEDSKIVGFCWCTMSDRGIDKQAEIAEFYIEEAYRGKGVGKQLLEAVKQLFINEKVTVAFVWTHYGNEAAIKLYESIGFKKVDQLVMALMSFAEKRQ